jgi:hypothetical protein
LELLQPPAKGRAGAWKMLAALLEYRPISDRTDLRPALRAGMEQLKHPSIVFFLSDFIGMDSLLSDPLFTRAAVFHDLIPIVIEDRLERYIPAVRGFVRLRDLEGGGDKLVSLSASNCEIFGKTMEERRRAVRTAFLRLGVIPVTLSTGQSPLQPLMSYFLQRRNTTR